jgi:hypothetical protein
LPHSHTTITKTSSSVHFAGDKLASKQLYWDQASVLVQVRALDRQRELCHGRERVTAGGDAAAGWLAGVGGGADERLDLAVEVHAGQVDVSVFVRCGHARAVPR